MENKETAMNETNKVVETLTKELESLSPEGLQEFLSSFIRWTTLTVIWLPKIILKNF